MPKAVRYPQLQDDNWLRDFYVGKGLSAPQIASVVGCTTGNVEFHMRRIGIKARGRHYEHWNSKTCERCGQSFTPSGPPQRFCSERCRLGTRPCEECGTEMPSVRYERRFCSQDCRAAWLRKQSKHRSHAHGKIVVH